MIIVCSGPDTFRARERMRALVDAFRAKHDAEGFSMETVDGSAGLPLLLGRLGSASLFSRKKLVRADGCLEALKIADIRTLAAKLKSDADATILCTVEESPPNAKTLDALKDAPVHHYPFPTLTGLAFKTWVRERAGQQGLGHRIADEIAECSNGDSWLAVNELQKRAASGTVSDVKITTDSSPYAIADLYIGHGDAWRTPLAQAGTDVPVTLILAQARSCVRVKDDATEGLHPYVVKKMRSVKNSDIMGKFVRSLRALALGRSGYASNDEWKDVL
ncbi:hypothetical protein L0Y59_02805 [Candidatus Uhrbacteria bacterium]|nr:hypothetical protein [Candidatus Uhrbacteria bacterium]